MELTTKRLFLFVVMASFGLTARAASHPNVIFILADDMGYGDVHCLNPERGKINTPHMDRLASEGMVFTDAHTSSSVCTPTRYGIMTGRYNWRSKLQEGVLNGYGEPLIPTDRLTVPAFLSKNGYHTAMVGKWHLGLDIATIDGKPAAPKSTASLRARMGKWKLLLAKGSGGWTAPNENAAAKNGAPVAQLYDMETDSGETTNLYASQPEVAARLLALLEADVARGRSTDGVAATNDVDQIKLWKSGQK